MVGQDIRTTTAGRRAVGPRGQEQADAFAGPGRPRHTQGRQQGARGAHKADASGDRQDLRRHVRMPKAAHPACVPGEVVAVLCAAGTRELSPILSVRRRVRPHTACVFSHRRFHRCRFSMRIECLSLQRIRIILH